MVEKSKLDEDKEGKAVDPSHYHGSGYRKTLTCGKKDLSIPTRNRQSGSMVSEGFFDCFNSFIHQDCLMRLAHLLLIYSKKDCWFRGKLRQHQHRHHQSHKLKLHMYLNLFHTRSLKKILSLHGKKVEAISKSAWTEKDRIDNFLKERRSILTDSQVTPTKHGRMTKPCSSHRFIANCFNVGHLKMEMKITRSFTSPLQNPKQLDEEFTTMAYPNVQENLKLPSEDLMIPKEPANFNETLSSRQNLKKEHSFTDQFLMEKQQEEELGKTNAEAEVQSMVSVPIHQDTSSVPPMTTPVIDLTTSQSGSPLSTSSATTSTVMTTTTIPPPPTQPQESTIDLTLMKRIDELEQHMAILLQYNLALEERLDKHGSWLYKLENLNLPHQVSKAIDGIVTDALDWAMQAPLQARFSDLTAVKIKEILRQWIFKDKSYEVYEDHKKLYDALEKSLERDYSDQLLSDLEEALQKKRKRRDVPRTPSGSPLAQPPPPPPLAGTSGDPAGLSETQELSSTYSQIPDDSIPDEQIHLSDDEDSRNDHLPTANSRKGWWKPLPAEERPATPKPT
nr:hypothetical protein [Tanacetum cinerariifolium]